MDSSVHSATSPLALRASTEAQVYLLFAIAMALSIGGVSIGLTMAQMLLTSGMHLFLLLAEMAIIFSAPLWINRRPMNYLLFAVFPLLSGITFTPYVLQILLGYANGASILLNALLATTFLSLAAAVFARITPWNLSGMARGLLFAVLGLIVFSLLQIFVPSLRTGTAELLISGAGIAIFGLFLSMDLQRIQSLGRLGANPIILALSLYLDIFNLFIYVLRFMTAMSGRRH